MECFPTFFSVVRETVFARTSGRTLADYLVTDLAAILAGYRRKDWKRALPKKIPGKDNLLLIIDDYESVSATLSDFLLTYFAPGLTRMSFSTLILILGRDRLIDTDVGWQQHFERHLLGDVALTSFAPDEAREYVLSRGIDSPSTVERIVTETAGFTVSSPGGGGGGT